MKVLLFSCVTCLILASCKTAYFSSPNDLNYISGTLFLSNGKTLEGKISVKEGWGGTVKIYLPGDKNPQRFDFSEVDGYKIRNEYYERKEIRDGGSLSSSFRFHFMKKLTPDNSKIGLYEYVDEQTYYASYGYGYRSRGTTPVTSLEKNYYVQLPHERGDGVWSIGQSKFVPNFDEKMSKLVEDCPQLSQKIANKEKGYFYSQFGGSDEKRVDMLWTIINEYNKCQ